MSKYLAMPLRARVAIILFAVVGVAVTGMEFAAAPPELGPCLVWMILASLAANIKVPLLRGSSISVLTAVVLMSLIDAGTTAAIMAGICGVTAQVVFPSREISLHRIGFNIGMIVMTVEAAAGAYQWLLSRPTDWALPNTYIAGVGASFIYGVVNALCIALIIALTQKQPVHRLWYGMLRTAAPSFLFAGVFALALLEFLRNPSADEMTLMVSVLYATYHFSVFLAGNRGTVGTRM